MGSPLSDDDSRLCTGSLVASHNNSPSAVGTMAISTAMAPKRSANEQLMTSTLSRREFIAGMGVVAASSALSPPIRPATGQFRFGYASITWEGKDRQAIEEIASLGFRGIQVRANVVKDFHSPGELRDLLHKRQLTLVALS